MSAPLPLDLGLDGRGDSDEVVATAGDSYQAGASVLGVGDPLDVASGHQLINEERGRLLGDLSGRGQGCAARPRRVDSL